MGNFNDIVPKRLNIVPARQATLQEAQNAPIPFDKYYTLKPTRDIKKIPTYLVLPPFNVPVHTVKYNGQMLFQYNVVAPAPFYILNAVVEQTAIPVGLFLTVKWRIGTTVYRYFIFGAQRYNNGGEIINLHSFPLYTNQLVPVNCVFEFWGAHIFSDTPGLLNGYKILTNIVSDPTTVDITEFDVNMAAPIICTNLGNNLPIALPFAQPTIAFNSN